MHCKQGRLIPVRPISGNLRWTEAAPAPCLPNMHHLRVVVCNGAPRGALRARLQNITTLAVGDIALSVHPSERFLLRQPCHEKTAQVGWRSTVQQQGRLHQPDGYPPWLPDDRWATVQAL